MPTRVWQTERDAMHAFCALSRRAAGKSRALVVHGVTDAAFLRREDFLSTGVRVLLHQRGAFLLHFLARHAKRPDGPGVLNNSGGGRVSGGCFLAGLQRLELCLEFANLLFFHRNQLGTIANLFF